MAFLPLIERELRIALRKKRPAGTRLRFAAVCAGGAILFVLFASLSGTRGIGSGLHKIFCLLGGYILLRTPRAASGAFADERRNQTLGLLFLSGLTPGEVFISKLISAAAVALTGLLAMFPMLALPFLIGGVSFDLFIATIFALPNLLLFLLAVTLLASVLTEDEGSAITLAAVIVITLCVLTVGVHFAQTQFSPGTAVSAWWLRLSPAYGPFLVWTNLGTGGVAEFWKNSFVTLGWSVVCLALAAVRLRAIWVERPAETETSNWVRIWRTFLRGDFKTRRALAARWLLANPFVWLAARDRKPAALAWIVVGGISAVWVICWAVWPQAWPSAPNFFITATLLNLAMRWLIQFTAARGIGEARHDGTYELLLTTPLNPSDIVWGQLEALGQQFRTVTRTVLVLEILMMAGGLIAHPYREAALYVYLMIWTGLLLWAWLQTWNWRATLQTMWASMNSAQPARAVWRCAGISGWSWWWILLNAHRLFRGSSRFPSGSWAEVGMVSVIALVILLVAVGRRSSRKDSSEHWESRLVSEFREIAREPVPDPDDQRFKQWDHRERFPWGWKIVQQQLHERIVRKERQAKPA